MFKRCFLYTLQLISTVLDMMTISYYLSVRIIENSDNGCSDNQDLTVYPKIKHANAQTCTTNTHTKLYTHTHTHTHTQTCTHTYTLVYTHIYTRVHTHVHTHTQSQVPYTDTVGSRLSGHRLSGHRLSGHRLSELSIIRIDK